MAATGVKLGQVSGVSRGQFLFGTDAVVPGLIQSPIEGVGTSGGGDGGDTDEGTSGARGGQKRPLEGASAPSSLCDIDC